jgi:hypothetical protein
MQFSDNTLLPSSGFIRCMHRALHAVFDSSLLICGHSEASIPRTLRQASSPGLTDLTVHCSLPVLKNIKQALTMKA